MIRTCDWSLLHVDFFWYIRKGWSGHVTDHYSMIILTGPFLQDDQDMWLITPPCWFLLEHSCRMIRTCDRSLIHVHSNRTILARWQAHVTDHSSQLITSWAFLQDERQYTGPNNRLSTIYTVTWNVVGKTTRNISCSIMFSSTFHVISQKFGLLF